MSSIHCVTHDRYHDIIRYVRRCITLNLRDTRLFLSQIDADHDGAVSLKDFSGFMMRYLH